MHYRYCQMEHSEMSDHAEEKRNSLDQGSFTPLQLPNNEAARTALEVTSDQELRVPCYCEENVYRLVVRKLAQQQRGSIASLCSASLTYFVAFISSETQCVPMYNQLASKSPSAPCFWDYHVIALEVTNNCSDYEHDRRELNTVVLDMDSRLPYPCPLDIYVKFSFPSFVQSHHAPLFRVIRAENFLNHFYSDRRHMLNKDGAWIATPPSYATISCPPNYSCTGNEDFFSNLDRYRIMTSYLRYTQSSNNSGATKHAEMEKKSSCQSPYGIVLSQDQFLGHFCRQQSVK